MMHVVTGGSGSGKSRFAEQQILDLGPANRIYIATMHPYDDESFARIDRHREMRKMKQFDTLECYTNLAELDVPAGSNVLLECMSNLTANEMFEPGAAGDKTVEAVLKGIRHVKELAANLVIVTNEIFSDGIEYDPMTQQYQQYLGQINQAMTKMADRVTEVVYGIPVHVKYDQEQAAEYVSNCNTEAPQYITGYNSEIDTNNSGEKNSVTYRSASSENADQSQTEPENNTQNA